MNISAIIMASGQSKRMGRNKLFLTYAKKTFLRHTLELVQKIPFEERILVVSPENYEELLFLQKQFTVVLNQEFEQGQSASVRLGTQAATKTGYLYLTIDQPLLTPRIIEQLLAEARDDNIVFPLKDGQPSSPVYFGKNFRKELLTVSGESGGRAVKNAHPEAWCPVVIEPAYLLTDIDTIDDYIQLQYDLEKMRNENGTKVN